MEIPIIENARVMAKGQVTIPKEIREAMQIGDGDRLTFIYDNKRVTIMNANIFAMQMVQKEMASEWEKAGIYSEADIDELCREVRNEVDKTGR
jgi:AbrB family looped-hinge helix DNA binding protein